MTSQANQVDTVRGRVQSIRELTSLPAVACRLLELLSDEDVALKELCSVIEQDPGLTARIVGIANSAYFARVRAVAGVEEATRVLGLNMVQGLAIGIALAQPFDVRRCPEFAVDRYWYRALRAAALAARLGPLTDLDDEQRRFLYLAGLVHNIGQLALVHALPGEMSDVFRQWVETPEPGLCRLERDLLGIDEIEAGAILALRWHLPDPVAAVIAHRRQPGEAGDFAALTEVVAWCGELAQIMYDDPDCDCLLQIGTRPAALTAGEDRVASVIDKLREQDDASRTLARSLVG